MDSKSNSTRRASLVLLTSTLIAACGGGGGGGATNPPPPTGPEALPTTTLVSDSGRTSFTFVTLNVWANAVVWDSVNQVLQVVTNNSSPTQPNSLLTINPTTGLVVAAQKLTVQPLAVAISADGQYVYVGFDMGEGVERFLAKTLAPDIKIPVGDNTTYIQDIQVSPINPHTIAVSAWYLVPLMQSPGVTIFDDAVMRPNMFQGTSVYPDPYFAYTNVNASEASWSPDGSMLYVFNITQEGLYEVSVNSQGMTLTNWLTWVPSGGIGGRIRGHLAYIDGGEVVDLTGPVQLLGQFPVGNNGSRYRAELLGSNKAFSVVDHYNSVPTIDGMILWAFDTNTYSIVDSLVFPGIASATEGNLSSWGNNGLVWTDSARLIIGSGNFTESGGAPPSTTSPDIAATGSVSGGAGTLNYQVFSAGALDVAADKCGNFYVSTAGYSSFLPNSVITMDPTKGMVKASVYAGSEPYYLSVSDDCTAIYAGLAQSSSVARIDAATMTLNETIPLPTSAEWGFVTARSLSVAPGAAHTIAVATETSGTGCLAIDNNVTIFDDLTPRAIVYTNPTSLLYGIRGVVFGSTANVLYGFDILRGLISFTVDATGVYNATVLTGLPGDFTQDGGRFMNFDGSTGRIYDQIGDVFDTQAVSSLRRIILNVGPFQEGSQCATPTQAVTTDVTTGKIFFVTWLGGGLPLEIDTYDKTSLALVATAQIPVSNNVGDFGPVLRVARARSDSLEIVTSTGLLVLLQGPMLGP
jgi:hypothetical protein